MEILEFSCLGEFQINRNGVPYPEIKTHKGLALLCYLAVTRRRFTRSALAGMFWAEYPEAGALMNLRKALNRLKPLTDYLTIARDTLAFHQEAPHRVDVHEFVAAAADRLDIARIQHAVALYQGDFLEGIELDDCPLFNEWVLSQRARLREVAAGCLQALIAFSNGGRNFSEAIRYARLLLALQPWHEETHRELMRLLARSGERSAALHQFDTCRRILRAELGVDPDPLTVQLFQQIAAGKQK